MSWNPDDAGTGAPQFNAHGFDRVQQHYMGLLEETITRMYIRQVSTQRLLLKVESEYEKRLARLERQIADAERRLTDAGL